jgi:hypothetical protein
MIYPLSIRHVFPQEIIAGIQNQIKENECYGTLGVPAESTLNTNNFSHINLKQISHKIKNVFYENDIMTADIEILKTPYGKILSQLLESKIPLRLSPRGLGTVDDTGCKILSYKLISIDFQEENEYNLTKGDLK